MGNSPSPLETLAAFAIVFVAGILSVMGVKAYAEKIRREHNGTASEPMPPS